MVRKLEVLITSGGTISKIDDIRHVGNFSVGTTGALIAEEFLRQGHGVSYVYGQHAKVPFKRNLAVDVNKPKKQEFRRVAKAYDEFVNYNNNLIEYPISTFESYYNTLKQILVERPVDVVVLAAAVGDYSAERVNGKISSDKDNLEIKMRKNPKVIQHIKEWNPEVYLVGFKLLSDVSDEELLNVAEANAKKTNSDMTVANLFPKRNMRDTKTYILVDGGALPLQRKSLPENLVKLVEYGLERKEEGVLSYA